MNEIKRTLVFVAIAAIITALTYFTLPKTEVTSPADMVGQSLFPNFQDALAATSLEVVKFDPATAAPVSFMVRKEGNSWVIPPKNYPADAQDQLAKAAADLIDLKVLSVAADPQEAGVAADDMKGLHRLYGVVDPASESASGAEGMGTRVSLRDKDDAKLVELVIGKAVEGQEGLRYVRRVGQDPVYTVKISPDKFSTKFQDWIEKDLLKLSSWDIRTVSIDDYSVDILQQSITPRGKIELEYNDTGEPRWKMTADRVFKKDGWVDQGLSEKEELNTDTLNNLKNALDDLKIVDVMRKPAALSDTLKGSGSINLDPEAERSLSRAGFHVVTISDPANPGQKSYQLRSNEGEIAVTMKDGVQYVLRFGQVAGMASEGADEEKTGKKADEKKIDEKKAEKKTESSTADVNRYLFVMAELRPEMIEKPAYEKLPELPAAGDKAGEQKPDDKAAEKKPAEPKKEEKKADEKKAESPKPEEKQSEAAKADEKKPADAGEKKAEEKKDGKSAADAKSEAAKQEGAAGEKPKAEEKKPTKEEIEKKREEIQKENDRKKEEYEKKIKDAEKKVADLNARFAEWYYVIADSEYQKIHLSRDKIVKAKEEKKPDKSASGETAPKPPAALDTLGDFESLKKEAPRP